MDWFYRALETQVPSLTSAAAAEMRRSIARLNMCSGTAKHDFQVHRLHSLWL